MIVLGFTGTRKGPTAAQLEKLGESGGTYQFKKYADKIGLPYDNLYNQWETTFERIDR